MRFFYGVFRGEGVIVDGIFLNGGKKMGEGVIVDGCICTIPAMPGLLPLDSVPCTQQR